MFLNPSRLFTISVFLPFLVIQTETSYFPTAKVTPMQLRPWNRFIEVIKSVHPITHPIIKYSEQEEHPLRNDYEDEGFKTRMTTPIKKFGERLRIKTAGRIRLLKRFG